MGCADIRARRSTRGLLLPLLVAAAACPVTGPDTEDDPPTPAKSLEERLVDAYMDYVETCMHRQYAFFYEVEPEYSAAGFDMGNMEDGIRASLDLQLASEHVTLDEAAAQACINFLTGSDCSSGLENPGVVCDDIFTGDLAAGAACASGPECAGDSVCWGVTDTECGTCKPRASAGADCTDTACVDGYFCDFSGATPVCTQEPVEPPPTVYSAGDSCDVGDERCGGWLYTGLACVDDNDDGVGTCTAVQVVGDGEGCAYTTHGEMTIACRNGLMGSSFCVIDIGSGSFSGTCEQRPGLGEPCLESFNVCDNTEAYCNTTSGMCEARTPNGGTCDPQQTSRCEIGSTCDSEDLVCRDMIQFESATLPVCS